MPTDRFQIPSESSRPDHLRRPSRTPPAVPPRTSAGGRPQPRSGVAPGRTPLRQVAAEARASLGTGPSELPQPGDWLWICRPGAEDDVKDELTALGIRSRPLQAGLLVSSPRSGKRAGQVPAAFSTLTFARQGFPVQLCRDLAGCELREAAALIVDGLYRGFKGRALAVHVFAADSDHGKVLSSRCTALAEALSQDLADRGYTVAASGPAAHSEGGQLLMVCLLTAETAIAGMQMTSSALSLHPGGVQRVRRPQDAPSRSAHKLSEALAWLGHGPQAGESCVDLGAAPGGWSQVLAQRGCPVIAVDTGGLAPGLSHRIKHVRQNAFDYAPEEPVDWLCCDLAYRPLEVAGLLARWGRRRWARFVIANIKLPMKQRVAMLDRVREILASGGWTGLKARQLYHDRDEVTLFAWRGFGLDTRVQPRRSAAFDETPTSRETSRPAPAKPAGRSPRKASPSSRDAGPPSRKSGSPSRKSGPPARKSGPPSRDAGPPSRKSGPPSRKSGPPARDAGPSSRKSGPPSRKSGPSARNAGPPSRGSGPPSRKAGPPSKKAGPPRRTSSAQREPVRGDNRAKDRGRRPPAGAGRDRRRD